MLTANRVVPTSQSVALAKGDQAAITVRPVIRRRHGSALLESQWTVWVYRGIFVVSRSGLGIAMHSAESAKYGVDIVDDGSRMFAFSTHVRLAWRPQVHLQAENNAI